MTPGSATIARLALVPGLDAPRPTRSRQGRWEAPVRGARLASGVHRHGALAGLADR
jgi:hypothetical protein